MVLQHLVVDGSNIATEGRELPSLAQLDEAVQAFIAEFGPQIVTVVVDASFPNRIAHNERKTYEDAVVAGEIITPPAGAIGRGDAFILQIADRAQATILSNDSFQEFHGQYDWLFDQGRLVGGKPVPHVGWVFVDRSPVRGPTSRRAVSLAKQGAGGQPAAPRARAARATKATKAAKTAKATKATPKAIKTTAKATKATKATKPTKAAKSGKAVEAAPMGPAPAERPAQRGAPGAKAPATGAPAPALPTQRSGAAAGEPAPGYNEALPFIEFVGAHPVGSRVDGVVEQFSSHGAYVRVDGVLAYAPLKHLADPAPRSAKQVLRIGETRSFVVVSVEPARRGVDLALPGVPLDAPAAPTEAVPAAPEPSRRRRGSRKATETPPADPRPNPATEPAPAKRSRARATKASDAPAEPGKAAAKKATKSAAKKATENVAKKATARKAEAARASTAAASAPSAAKPAGRKAPRAKKAAGAKKAAPTSTGGRAADQ